MRALTIPYHINGSRHKFAGDDEHRAIAEACCAGEAGYHHLHKQGSFTSYTHVHITIIITCMSMRECGGCMYYCGK